MFYDGKDDFFNGILNNPWPLIFTFWVIVIIIFLIILLISYSNKQNFNDNLEKNIDNEIKNFLINKNNPNYEFKNKDIKLELKQRLKSEMIDLRGNGYRYKPSYKNKTLKKEKDLYNLINKYYILDQKNPN